ncbi:MAG: hypothetical protein ABR607_17595, partial [Pyrinomonadaceae bacterium]
EQSIDELGFGFLFAPSHHPAMRHAAPVRKELATRTVFNVLGPLTNPAGARAQVVGVYSEQLVHTIAEVLARLGAPPRQVYICGSNPFVETAAQALIARTRHVQSSLATPDLKAWRDLDGVIVALENRCRGLHARYLGERPALLALCDRLVARAPADGSAKRKVG